MRRTAFSSGVAAKITLKEPIYALDDIRDTPGFVAIGAGKFLHPGRFYSHSVGAGISNSCDQPPKRAK